MALYSWVRHLTLKVPLSTQVCEWVTVNLMLGVTLRWTRIPSRGEIQILLVVSCCRNQDNLRADGPLGSRVDFTFIAVYCKLSLLFLFVRFSYTHRHLHARSQDSSARHKPSEEPSWPNLQHPVRSWSLWTAWWIHRILWSPEQLHPVSKQRQTRR